MQDNPQPKKPESGVIRLLSGALKLSGVLIGFPITIIVLTAIAGTWIDSFWLRFGGALVVTIALPFVIVEWILPVDPRRARGVTTDVLAVLWLGVAVASAGFGHSATRPYLVKEADRLSARGMKKTADATYWLARARYVPRPTSKKNNASKALARAKPKIPAPKTKRPATPKTPVASTPPSGPPQSLVQLFRRCSPSVVSISAQGSSGVSSGTGFVIDKRGTIVTNYHVIKNARRVRIKISGKWINKVILLSENRSSDVALLQVKVKASEVKLRPIALGDSSKIQVGERVITIGNPLGLDHTLTDGVVSARRIYKGKPMVQMSTPISPGNSGGPLINMRGQVVGIATASLGERRHGAQNLNLAVPVNVMKKMIKSKYPSARTIGTVRVAPTTSGTW